MELIALKNIAKQYGEKRKITALYQFDLSVQKGDMVAIMGRSGSGKSTVLNLLAGIDALEIGEYWFQGKDMTKLSQNQMTVFRRDHIGFVLQHFALIPNYTIFDNIAFPLRLRKESGRVIREKVREIAEELGIETLLQKYPNELSGGEAQRAAIARAVIHQPELILADEPTGALDEENGCKIMKIFQKLHEKGNTIILVTHDENVAAMCERTIRIRDGRKVCG